MQVDKDGEILDLVDENDNVIGEVLKVKANQDPSLIHREIAVIIFDDKNRVLFQQRSKNKPVNPGKWAISCAGHVTKGLTPEEAAHMELREELGFDTDLIFIEKTLYKGEKEVHFTYWFIGKYKGEKIIIEKEEVEQAVFLDEDGMQEIINSGALYTRSLDWATKFWNGEFNELVEQLSVK